MTGEWFARPMGRFTFLNLTFLVSDQILCRLMKQLLLLE